MNQLFQKLGYALLFIGMIFLTLAILCMKNVIFNQSYTSKLCTITLILNIIAAIFIFFPPNKKEHK